MVELYKQVAVTELGAALAITVCWPTLLPVQYSRNVILINLILTDCVQERQGR